MSNLSSINSWGPSAWTFMHAVSFSYNEHPTMEDKEKALQFMYGIAHMIPCNRCRQEWTQYLEVHMQDIESPNLQSRYAFSQFLVNGHNYVNRRLGKAELSYEYVKNMYTGQSPRVGYTNIIVKYIITFLIIILLWHVFTKRRRFSRH
jgi:hypothetical protein